MSIYIQLILYYNNVSAWTVYIHCPMACDWIMWGFLVGFFVLNLVGGVVCFLGVFCLFWFFCFCFLYHTIIWHLLIPLMSDLLKFIIWSIKQLENKFSPRQGTIQFNACLFYFSTKYQWYDSLVFWQLKQILERAVIFRLLEGVWIS